MGTEIRRMSVTTRELGNLLKSIAELSVKGGTP